jgi:hypothetical protein
MGNGSSGRYKVYSSGGEYIDVRTVENIAATDDDFKRHARSLTKQNISYFTNPTEYHISFKPKVIIWGDVAIVRFAARIKV